jgi:PKHD-type hydroxylase
MLLEIPGVLSPAELSEFRRRLDAAAWIDGNATSGHQSAQAKFNEQLAEGDGEARALGERVVAALGRNPLFFAAALPKQVFPPLFNRYGKGMAFANHVDGAMRTHGPTGVRIRTDLSATLFLSRPDEYDGGELLIEDAYGVQRVKLAAGSAVLYPSTSVHRVEPITRGARLACILWVQSMVREDARRSTLFDLDMAIVRLNRSSPGDPALVSLVGVYHNLLRMWADP